MAIALYPPALFQGRDLVMVGSDEYREEAYRKSPDLFNRIEAARGEGRIDDVLHIIYHELFWLDQQAVAVNTLVNHLLEERGDDMVDSASEIYDQFWNEIDPIEHYGPYEKGRILLDMASLYIRHHAKFGVIAPGNTRGLQKAQEIINVFDFYYNQLDLEQREVVFDEYNNLREALELARERHIDLYLQPEEARLRRLQRALPVELVEWAFENGHDVENLDQ